MVCNTACKELTDHFFLHVFLMRLVKCAGTKSIPQKGYLILFLKSVWIWIYLKKKIIIILHHCSSVTSKEPQGFPSAITVATLVTSLMATSQVTFFCIPVPTSLDGACWGALRTVWGCWASTQNNLGPKMRQKCQFQPRDTSGASI